MIVDYDRGMEIIGFALLIAAALRDRQLRRRGTIPLPNSNHQKE